MDLKKTKECVLRCRQGDTEAFEELYKATSKRVYFICYNLLKNEHDAKDAEQDVYLSVYMNLDKLEDPEKFGSWIERSAVHRCQDILRKKLPEPVDDDTLKETICDEDELSLPDKYVINAEKRRIVMKILKESLSDLQYQTVMMFYFSGYSAARIAEDMKCSEGAVKNRLATARTKLRKAIEELEKGEDEDDKLFVFVGVPFLTEVFNKELEDIKEPDDWDSILAKLLKESGKAGAAAIGGTAGGILIKWWHIAAVFGVIAVLTVSCIVLVTGRFGDDGENGGVPTDSPASVAEEPSKIDPDIDPNAGGWRSESSQEEESQLGIKIPGYPSITIPANQTEVTIGLLNPEGNPCYFKFELVLKDTDETLFETKLVPPGQAIMDVTLNRPLDAGEYNAVIKITTQSLDDLSAMNGANVETVLTVK